MARAKRAISAYRRIYEALQRRAATGEGPLVSETALMDEFSVSRDTARKALRSRDFDGVFCTQAELSLHLLGALESFGWAPGGEKGFISYEDLPEFENRKPAISAVRVPLSRMGERMRAELLAMLRFGYRDEVRVAMDEDLVLRGSE